MKEKLLKLLEEAKTNVAGLGNMEEAEALRVKLLGKKGEITEILRSMKDLAPEERKTMGQIANETKAQIENLISEKMDSLKKEAKAAKLEAEAIDVTEPGKVEKLGASHLITKTIDEITDIFMSMGFSVAEGPEESSLRNNQ